MKIPVYQKADDEGLNPPWKPSNAATSRKIQYLWKFSDRGGIVSLSISIIIVKEIDGFSCAATLHSIQQAAAKANLHCIHVETLKYFDRLHQTDIEYLSGSISEVNAETLKLNFEKGIHSKQFGFDIEPPTDTAYDSFTWLVNKKNYFGAVDLHYISCDFEFVFRFLSQYFRQRENINDYLWIDDTDWCYSAEEMIWLSTQPYTAEWAYRKLTAT